MRAKKDDIAYIGYKKIYSDDCRFFFDFRLKVKMSECLKYKNNILVRYTFSGFLFWQLYKINIENVIKMAYIHNSISTEILNWEI